MIGQLTLEVGWVLEEELPITGVVKIGGSLRVPMDLRKDQVVMVVVLDQEGVELAKVVGEVTAVTLRTKRTETSTFVERAHAVTLAQA